jgi:hypothetical protein
LSGKNDIVLAVRGVISLTREDLNTLADYSADGTVTFCGLTASQWVHVFSGYTPAKFELADRLVHSVLPLVDLRDEGDLDGVKNAAEQFMATHNGQYESTVRADPGQISDDESKFVGSEDRKAIWQWLESQELRNQFLNSLESKNYRKNSRLARIYRLCLADQSSGLPVDVNFMSDIKKQLEDYESHLYSELSKDLVWNEPKPTEKVKEGNSGMRSWAEMIDSDELKSESVELARARRDDRRVTLPGGFAEMWPTGYKGIREVAELHGLEVVESTSITMSGSGFADHLGFDKNVEVRRKHYDQLSTDAQRVEFHTLKCVVIFLRNRPKAPEVENPLFAVAASYALHYLLKVSTKPEDQELLAHSLKNPDGGKKLVRDRIVRRFATDEFAADLLMEVFDRLFTLNAKLHLKTNELTLDEINVVRSACFTSKAGMLSSWMKRVTKTEAVWSEETDAKGRKKKVKSFRKKTGLVTPEIKINSEFLKPEEKTLLTPKVESFNDCVGALTNILQALPVQDYLTPARASRQLVVLLYGRITPVNAAIKRRKDTTRSTIISEIGQGTPITQAKWLAVSERIVKEAPPLDKSVIDTLDMKVIIEEVKKGLGAKPQL